MSIMIGNNPVKGLYVGSNPVKAVYRGSTLIWQSGPKMCNVTVKETVEVNGLDDGSTRVFYSIMDNSGNSYSSPFTVPEGTVLTLHGGVDGDYGDIYYNGKNISNEEVKITVTNSMTLNIKIVYNYPQAPDEPDTPTNVILEFEVGSDDYPDRFIVQVAHDGPNDGDEFYYPDINTLELPYGTTISEILISDELETDAYVYEGAQIDGEAINSANKVKLTKDTKAIMYFHRV